MLHAACPDCVMNHDQYNKHYSDFYADLEDDISTGKARGLQGVPGPKGDTGPRGIRGLQGEVGITGAQGMCVIPLQIKP